MRWIFDRVGSVYRPAQSVFGGQPFPPQPRSYFVGQAMANLGRNVFVGLPVGTGELFAVDRDGDDLFDGDEVAVYGTNPTNIDTDGDGYRDGHEVKNPNPGGNPLIPTVHDPVFGASDGTNPTATDVRTLWFNQRQATIVVETDEPTTILVTYSANGLSQRTDVSSTFAKQHRVVLDELVPSTAGGPLFTFTGTVRLTDLAGNWTIIQSLPNPPPLFGVFGPTPITTPTFQSPTNEVVLGNLQWMSAQSNYATQTFAATAKFRVESKLGGPPAIPLQGQVAIFRVFQDGTPIAFASAGAQMFSVNTAVPANPPNPPIPTLYSTLSGAVPGPFLVADVATDSFGDGTVSFTLSGLTGHPKIMLAVEFVGPTVGAFDTANPFIEWFNRWSLPDTPAQFRAVETTY
jgi:hypothetical protein